MIRKSLALVFLSIAITHADTTSVLFGKWKVASYYVSTMAAMHDSVASKTYLNKKARYAPGFASFLKESCKLPAYRIGTVKAEDYFFGDLTVPTALGITNDSIRVVSVLCDSTDWAVPGGIVLLISESKIILSWRKIYLVMKKLD